MDQVKILEYQAAVRTVVMAAQLIEQHDVPRFLRAIGTADSIGPIVDPTLWRTKAPAMLIDREFLEAALPLFNVARKFREAAEARAATIEALAGAAPS